jgi:UDP-glucose 4-epimerase
MQPPARRRAIVAGAGGFVGANLAHALAAEGDEVVAVVAPWTDVSRLNGLAGELERCDVADGAAVNSLFERVRPDVVFNLICARPAGEADDTARCLRTNVVALAGLLDAAGEQGARVVHLGSSTEYAPNGAPLRETDPIEPTTVYGASKAAGTFLCLALARSHGVDVVVLRPFMVYGPWDRPSRFVPTAVDAALTGAVLPLTPPGLSRDWVYVDDAVEACLRAAAAPTLAGSVLNVGTGVQASPEEIAGLLGQISGRPLRTQVGGEPPRAWDRGCWVADVSALEQALGWRPQTALRDGLAATYAWHRGRAAA